MEWLNSLSYEQFSHVKNLLENVDHFVYVCVSFSYLFLRASHTLRLPRTHNIYQAGQESSIIALPQLPECWGSEGEAPHLAGFFRVGSCEPPRS